MAISLSLLSLHDTSNIQKPLAILNEHELNLKIWGEREEGIAHVVDQ